MDKIKYDCIQNIPDPKIACRKGRFVFGGKKKTNPTECNSIEFYGTQVEGCEHVFDPGGIKLA